MNADISRINTALRKAVDDVIINLDLESNINEQLRATLAHLTEIDLVYSQSQDQLYQTTMSKIQEVPLLPFEAEILISRLIQKYFKRLALFRETYEIAILRSKKDKYQHLQITEPFIQAKIPIPYNCAPLSQAQFISDATCLSLEQEEQA